MKNISFLRLLFSLAKDFFPLSWFSLSEKRFFASFSLYWIDTFMYNTFIHWRTMVLCGSLEKRSWL
jgi:hypothetical protein